MTFQEWQATRKWTDDLSAAIDCDVGEKVPGWHYHGGAHIHAIEWGCTVIIENTEREFKELEEAEQYLWDAFAKDECNAG